MRRGESFPRIGVWKGRITHPTTNSTRNLSRLAPPERTEGKCGGNRSRQEDGVEDRRTEEKTGEDRRTQENRGEHRRTQESSGEQRRTQESSGELRRTEGKTGEHRRTVRH